MGQHILNDSEIVTVLCGFIQPLNYDHMVYCVVRRSYVDENSSCNNSSLVTIINVLCWVQELHISCISWSEASLLIDQAFFKHGCYSVEDESFV